MKTLASESLKVFFPKPDAKHKLGGPFTEAFNRMALNVVAKAENGMRYDVTDPAGRIAPFELRYGRPKDALKDIGDRLADLAIVGRDCYDEYVSANPRRRAPVIQADLGFSPCTLVAAVPERDAAGIGKPADLMRLKRGAKLLVATSYPATTKRWLEDNGIAPSGVKFLVRDGGIEGYEADVTVDLTQSGASLDRARLKRLFDVAAPSTALLVTRPGVDTPQSRQLVNRIVEACGVAPALMAA